jgi:hypothetical protein
MKKKLTVEQSIVQRSVKTITVSNWNKIRNKIKNDNRRFENQDNMFDMSYEQLYK